MVEDLDHVLGVERGQDATLTQEARHGGLVVRQARGEDLERHRELVLAPNGPVDSSHSAAAVFAHDAILVEVVLRGRLDGEARLVDLGVLVVG